MNYIPYGRQDISQEDIDEVVSVLRSDWLTQGPSITRFEENICKTVDSKHAIAMCNATAALHLACLALGVGEGDIVWTSPITFVASANCALFCGATVDFVDIDQRTYNMSVQCLEQKLINAEKAGRLPKVVIPVHFGGTSVDMQAIAKLADKYGFSVIEDASHAIGGSYKGRPVGCCQYSDIAVFSFHPVKIVTTGEGGVCVTNSPALAEKIQDLRTHGITKNAQKMASADVGPWFYEMQDLGFNYRITDIQCALGVSQLSKLNSIIEKRNTLASSYKSLLKNLPLKVQSITESVHSAYHLFVVELTAEAKRDRRSVFDILKAGNIGANVHYIPVHLQPYYEQLGFRRGMFPVSEQYYDHAITLPLFPGLTRDQQVYIVDMLRDAIT